MSDGFVSNRSSNAYQNNTYGQSDGNHFLSGLPVDFRFPPTADRAFWAVSRRIFGPAFFADLPIAIFAFAARAFAGWLLRLGLASDSYRPSLVRNSNFIGTSSNGKVCIGDEFASINTVN